MKLGQATAKVLGSVGVTKERVTAIGQAAGILAPGEDCGCSKREKNLDDLGDAAVGVVKSIFGRPAEESELYFEPEESLPVADVAPSITNSDITTGKVVTRRRNTFWIDGKQYLNLNGHKSAPSTETELLHVSQCDGVAADTKVVREWASSRGIEVIHHAG